jgi:branched-subunit amino acid transport protein
MSDALLLLGMMLVTFGVRYPTLAIIGRLDLPDPFFRALRFVPPAVLTAIIAPAMLMPAGPLDISHTNAYLVAGIASVGVAWWRKNLLLTILVGMAVFLLWRMAVGG